MSFYVRRVREGREGWVGPIRSEHQANRERDAWCEVGWAAEIHPSSPEVRKAVNAWQREADRRLGRIPRGR